LWEQPKSDDFWRLCNHLITPVAHLDHTFKWNEWALPLVVNVYHALQPTIIWLTSYLVMLQAQLMFIHRYHVDDADGPSLLLSGVDHFTQTETGAGMLGVIKLARTANTAI